MLTLNKLLTRVSILLAQIKVGNNSHKLKNEKREILYLLTDCNWTISHNDLVRNPTLNHLAKLVN